MLRIFLMLVPDGNAINQLLTSQTCHQHKLSPTLVTNIDVARLLPKSTLRLVMFHSLFQSNLLPIYQILQIFHF